MKKLISTLCLAGSLLAGGTASAAQVSIGIQIGPPPPARVVRVLPGRPAPEYVWIEGYWYPVRGRYVWHEGYWTLPPYSDARWISPRYENRVFVEGYWTGNRGRVDHDHRSDRRHDRDRWRKDRRHDRGHDDDRYDRR